MKSILGSLLVFAACSSGSASLPDKGDLAGKADADTAALCEAAELPADCDLCDELGWYEDGVCDTFCAKPDPDCGPAIPAAISSQFAGGVLPPVHPLLGVWTISKPGVFPVATRLATGAALASEAGVGWVLEPTTCSVQIGESTYNGCEDTAPTGCFLAQGNAFTPISSIQRMLEEYEIVTASAEDKAAAAATEANIEFVVTAETAHGKFYYGMIDGVLYLLVVDAASLDCSA